MWPLQIKDIDGTRQRLTIWQNNVDMELELNKVYSFKNLQTDKYPKSDNPPYHLKTTNETKIKLLSGHTQKKFQEVSLTDFNVEGNERNFDK